MLEINRTMSEAAADANFSIGPLKKYVERGRRRFNALLGTLFNILKNLCGYVDSRYSKLLLESLLEYIERRRPHIKSTTMSSGRGLHGGVSRCYPFFAEFKECLVSTQDEGDLGLERFSRLFLTRWCEQKTGAPRS